MGGGKSSSSSSNSQSDNDVIVSGLGATVIAEGGQLDKSDNSQSVGMGGTLVEVGGGVNTGSQFGSGTVFYTEMGLDERSYQLIDTAMTLQHANTENFMELTAEREGIDAGKITPINPQPSGQQAAANPLTLSKNWVLGIVFAVIVVLVVFTKRKKKS